MTLEPENPNLSPPAADAPAADSVDSAHQAFSEKAFYLEEFHGRTVAIAVAASELEGRELQDRAALRRIVSELVANETHVLLLSTDPVLLSDILPSPVLTLADLDAELATLRLGGIVWRGLRERGAMGIVISDGAAFWRGCRLLSVQLGLTKLVWIDRDGGLVRPSGERISFMHLAELASFEVPESPRRARLLREVQALLTAGVPAVNVCAASGLEHELFSYDGSGTLFTEQRYVVVRRLGIDDYDAASDLIRRGVAEGYLAPRTPAQSDLVLATGFGAFIEGQHLAGIGALIPSLAEPCAEVASLYTLTRFLGEGVGRHLVQHAVECAHQQGLRYVFACTTSERVVSFFERSDFVRVEQDRIPCDKWDGYAGERRRALLCVRRDL